MWHPGLTWGGRGCGLACGQHLEQEDGTSPNAGPSNTCNICSSIRRQGSLTKLRIATWQDVPGAVASGWTAPRLLYLASKASSTLTSSAAWAGPSPSGLHPPHLHHEEYGPLRRVPALTA